MRIKADRVISLYDCPKCGKEYKESEVDFNSIAVPNGYYGFDHYKPFYPDCNVCHEEELKPSEFVEISDEKNT